MAKKEYAQQLRNEAALDEIQRAEDREGIAATMHALEHEKFITMEEMVEQLECASAKRENEKTSL